MSSTDLSFVCAAPLMFHLQRGFAKGIFSFVFFVLSVRKELEPRFITVDLRFFIVHRAVIRRVSQSRRKGPTPRLKKRRRRRGRPRLPLTPAARRSARPPLVRDLILRSAPQLWLAVDASRLCHSSPVVFLISSLSSLIDGNSTHSPPVGLCSRPSLRPACLSCRSCSGRQQFLGLDVPHARGRGAQPRPAGAPHDRPNSALREPHAPTGKCTPARRNWRQRADCTGPLGCEMKGLG